MCLMVMLDFLCILPLSGRPMAALVLPGLGRLIVSGDGRNCLGWTGYCVVKWLAKRFEDKCGMRFIAHCAGYWTVHSEVTTAPVVSFPNEWQNHKSLNCFTNCKTWGRVRNRHSGAMP